MDIDELLGTLDIENNSNEAAVNEKQKVIRNL